MNLDQLRTSQTCLYRYSYIAVQLTSNLSSAAKGKDNSSPLCHTSAHVFDIWTHLH